MKKTILYTLFLCLSFSLSLQAQTWIKKQEAFATNFLNRMYFTSATTGYAVYGDNTGGINNVLKTTNGGFNWTYYNSANSNAGYDLTFTSANIGYICSFNGEVSKTINAGINWTRVYTNGTNNNLYSIGFFDANTGFCGGFGYVTRTINAGANWTDISLTGFQYGSTVLSSTKAMMCGTQNATDGGVWTSTNSGASWVYTLLSASNTLFDVFFADANTGFTGGAAGTLYKTTNGGTGWSPLTSGTTNTINCVYFQNANTGFICGGSGFVSKTTNGGSSWTASTTLPTVTSQSNYEIYFSDANNGIMSTSSGSFFKTSDAGVTWQMIGNNIQLNGIAFTDASTGYAAGVSSVIQKTIDGGNSWTMLNPGTTINFNCLEFPNASTGYVAGLSGTIVKTTNGGTNWTTLTSGVATTIFTLDFLDVNTGYYGTTAGGMRITTNGGANWTALTTGLATNITGVSFVDANTGYLCTTLGNVRKTTNGGTNWTALTTGITNNLSSIFFINSNSGWAVGATGKTIRTTNGGTNWDSLSVSTPGFGFQALSFVRFGSANAGIAVGSSGTILVTNNGGASWTAQTSNTTANLRCVSLQASNNIFICGANGTILNSSDQVLPVELSSFTSTVQNNRDVRLNWQTVTETNNSGFEIERTLKAENEQWSKLGFVTGNGTTNNQHSYAFEDKNLSAGIYMYRLKQIDYNGNYEYKNLTNEVIIGKPNSFELSQNYPNPFNPSTKIVFSLPFDSKVTLKIFDITGKEIKTLLNEFKSANFYTIDFNASELPSGIYFCKISAQSDSKDFAKTIKMILSK